MKYKSSPVQIRGDVSGPHTGVALLYPRPAACVSTTRTGSPSTTRPILIISSGRHEVAMCYAIFPEGEKGYSEDGVAIVEGQFSNVSVSGDLILFVGNSNAEKSTPSQIYQLNTCDRSAMLLWTDVETHSIRNGSFVRNSDDIMLVGASRKDNDEQQAQATYYSRTNLEDGHDTWKLQWKHTTSNPNEPYTVGVSALVTPSKSLAVALGNRISWMAFNDNKDDVQLVTSCIFSSPLPLSSCRQINTNMQTVACYIGPILSLAEESDDGVTQDVIFIGGGQAGQSAQSFLLTEVPTCASVLVGEHADTIRGTSRIDLGPPMDGRSVVVHDFSGNGLLDIFIVCVQGPHMLLLQKENSTSSAPLTQSDIAEEREVVAEIGALLKAKSPFVVLPIDNVLSTRGGDKGELEAGEARGVTVGRLYGNTDTIEVAITDAAIHKSSTNIACWIYSFSVAELQEALLTSSSCVW